jgi:hypothetical protein
VIVPKSPPSNIREEKKKPTRRQIEVVSLVSGALRPGKQYPVQIKIGDILDAKTILRMEV